jgi:DNA repair exonuclease SbcCD ATPase subunit
VPPFGLFKKKPSDLPVAEQSTPVPTSDSLSIRQAQELLESLESAKVKELSASLIRIKESAAQSLKVIDTLAKDMDKENIKLEELELRLKSVVEHSKRTVVSSLKREASTELPYPQTANDAKKFRDRFENMMKRIGEVSGSHSKVLNAFMKKHSGKMKGEFEQLTKLLNDTREVIADFDRECEPIKRCENMLNTAVQKISSIKSVESSVKKIENEIGEVERELDTLGTLLGALTTSQEYHQAFSNQQKISEAAKKQEEFHAKVKDLFSRLSRAFTKYSYGITKETEQRLKILSEEPWKILYEDKDNLSPYSSLMREIRDSLVRGQIQLKDSDKVIHYANMILESLPDLQHKAQTIKKEIDSSRELNVQPVDKVRSLQYQIMQYTEELGRSRQELEQQRRQVKDKTEELHAILTQACEVLAELTGRKYYITYTE